MTSKFISDRSLLRFSEEVKSRFSFIEPLGFRCVRSEATLVRFESSKIAITVYHEKLSYEISSAIEKMHGSDVYSFSEVMCLVNGERIEQHRDYAAHTVEGVAEGVRKLADLFRKCVEAGILNDSELFYRLKLQREEWTRSYSLDTQLEQARKIAALAWAEKDFRRVVQALSPLQEHLDATDLKKLKFARKRAIASM